MKVKRYFYEVMYINIYYQYKEKINSVERTDWLI